MPLLHRGEPHNFDVIQDYIHMSESSSPTNLESDNSSDSGYASSRGGEQTTKLPHFFIPAPADLTREETHAYHVTTRNYFAYILSMPLVGEHLGTALVRLWRRIQAWQPRTAQLSSFMTYCDQQGYMHLTDNPRYALAMLCFAEEVRLRDTWIDAFTHCVGMHKRLHWITETEQISNMTKTLISHAGLELDMHTAHMTRILGEFLEYELGPDTLGLTKPSRDHLDRFRSFLHAFYVQKQGYFPPNASDRWDKRLWVGMYYDFRSLYEYLADTESNNEQSSSRGVNGGVCVLQNVRAFDERHGYSALPHPLCLLPDIPIRGRTMDSSQKGFRSMKLGRIETCPELHTNAGSPSAVSACNSANIEVTSNSLVREYIRFERETREVKVTAAEARKVRWLLVYGMMQTLVSIIQAPTEVQDTQSPSYPLCVSTKGCPPWNEEDTELGAQESSEYPVRCSAEMEYVRRTLELDRISIHPDCEAENAEQYFAQTGLSRSDSNHDQSMLPTPLRIGTQFTRRASLMSTVHSVQSFRRSVVGSIQRRSISRPSKNASPYGAPPLPDTNADLEDLGRLTRQRSFGDFPDEGAPRNAGEFELSHSSHDRQPLEPISTTFDHYASNPHTPSNRSTFSSNPSISNRSASVDGEDYDPRSPISDVSSWDGPHFCGPAAHAEDNDHPELAAFDFDFAHHDPSLLHYRPLTHGSPYASYDHYTSSKPTNVNAGCYVPSGSGDGSRTPLSRKISALSLCSSASSSYPEDSVQADEIEEEETRGRRRWRALDRLPGFGAIGSAMTLLATSGRE